MSSAGPLGDAVGLLREIGRDVRATRRKAAFHSPHPPAEGLVLDVGAGHMPEPRADVVVDKYAADDFERASGLDLRKPVVVGDGHALPFADNAFAYVVASHVLEHATDVDAFAAELATGRRGRIRAGAIRPGGADVRLAVPSVAHRPGGRRAGLPPARRRRRALRAAVPQRRGGLCALPVVVRRAPRGLAPHRPLGRHAVGALRGDQCRGCHRHGSTSSARSRCCRTQVSPP